MFFTVQAGKGYNISHFCHNFNVKNDGTWDDFGKGFEESISFLTHAHGIFST